MDESPRPFVHSVDSEKSVVAGEVANLNMGDVRQYRINLARHENKVYVWNVPPRAHTFTGREDELEEIRQGLGAGQGVALCQALVGGGGYGKTALAAEYAWRTFEGYASCVWLNAETYEKLNASLAELYRSVDPDGSLALDIPTQTELGRRWLAAPTRLLHNGLPLLVVLDNAPSPQGALTRLALGPGVRVLATTRSRNVGSAFQRILVELLPIEAAQLLLLRRSGHVPPGGVLEDAPEAERAHAKDAAETLGRLALALDQVGAQFENRSLGEFPLWWKKRREHVLQRYGVPEDGFHESVWVTVLGAWEALRDENPAAAQMVLACAWLDPDRIPLELFVLAAPYWPEPLTSAVADPLDAALLADVAAARSLIEVREDPIPLRWPETNELFEELLPWRSLSIHRLTQEVLRLASALEYMSPRQTDVVLALASGFPGVEHQLWALHERMLPSWRSALAKLPTETAGAGHLAYAIGGYLRERGSLDDAKAMFGEAQRIEELASKCDFSLIADCMNGVGAVLLSQGDLDGSLNKFCEAERTNRGLYGDSHPRVATCLSNQGAVLRTRGDVEDAIKLYREAVRIYRDTYPDGHPSIGTYTNNLGNALQAQGKLDEAMEYLREAEQIDRAFRGDNHPDVARDINNIGAALHAKGDIEGALDALQEAERIYRAVYGNDHPSLAACVNNIGLVFHSQGDFEMAMAAYREAEKIDRSVYGDNHPDVARDMNNIAGVLHSSGDADGAIKAYREAERIVRLTFGVDHPHLATCMNNIAGALIDCGDSNGAVNAYTEALIIAFRSFGPYGSNVSDIALSLLALDENPFRFISETFGEDATRNLRVAMLERVERFKKNV